MDKKLESIIKKEKEKATEYLENFKRHYLQTIEKAITSGAVNSGDLESEDYTFVKVVFNILGTNETPVSQIGKDLKKNLKHFIS